MTRKDYVLLARALRDAPLRTRGGIILALADALAADNPRFDRERFLLAAGA